MTKVKEVRKSSASGMGGYRQEVRVRKLAKGEELPADAETVPDDTPETDWQEEEEK